MYNVFNSFLDVETWYKDHPNDNERFYAALSSVVNKPDFSPDEMAAYMRNYKNSTNNDAFTKRIDDLQNASWHIKDYLKFTS